MIAFGKEQQTARGFEIERLAAAGERADDDSARRGERLFGRPQAFLALGRADEDEACGIEAELGKAGRVRRAVLGKDAVLTGPDHPGLLGPAGGKAQAEAQNGGFRARASWTQLVQRLAGHSGSQGGKTMLQGGWTRTHVLYMFYTPDSR